VLYLGAAYNKSLVETGSIDDGYTIARTYFNGTFKGEQTGCHGNLKIYIFKTALPTFIYD